eukprot:TRINITY_DN6677_c0_g1_i1.p1 TRINITY_DN6677_c0_g1~~TRINITY_DN6677_c0_g1_i1.p1  ORF type:complete len:129 (+),score=35.55 TRINITY_DN6677_c0_g1_i1:23-388(+)
MEELSDWLVEKAISLNGTASGEHGVGIGKSKFLEMEHGAALVDTMRHIKKAVDPLNVMNPGKIFPKKEECCTKNIVKMMNDFFTSAIGHEEFEFSHGFQMAYEYLTNTAAKIGVKVACLMS